MKKLFVSYCHRQGEWVWDRLVPCLKAGGAEVLIDRERFQAGKGVLGQMDAVQDQAELHLLVLSPEYLASKYCTHEMQRAVDKDPTFTRGSVIPVVLAECKLPLRIKRPEPVYVNLRDDSDAGCWDQLLSACDVDLGVDAPQWLAARDELRQHIELGRSVNLVVSGRCRSWSGLIDHLADSPTTRMVRVDLNSARTIERPGLLACMLDEADGAHNLPAEPRDLAEFQRIVMSRSQPSRVALAHFDQVRPRKYGPDYFSTLRFIWEQRKLLLLIQSRKPFESLLGEDERVILSCLDIKTVELKGRK